MTRNPDNYIGKRAIKRDTGDEGTIISVNFNTPRPTAKFHPDNLSHLEPTDVYLDTLTILDPQLNDPGYTIRTGYVNPNRQKNVGPLDRPGTDHNQMLYRMRCGDCMLDYAANGSDIFQRRCPHCQDGAPSTGGWEP
jgi:hypothetical protein